ncbi:MAG TPA: hypothetical protein VKZ53_17865 [Candidatus Angelobacter sp.]|nr:hypothetical protein [Candidatus Angelobacter sp.]
MATDFSARLKSATSELRDIEKELKLQDKPDAQLLQAFREALDNARTTAWTVNELQNVRQSGASSKALQSFLAAERLRRVTKMVEDLCAALESGEIAMETHAIETLSGFLDTLQSRLSALNK